MARPRSSDRRSAIILAATRVILSQGLSASTAMIAQEAGVPNGSLFTYFETKADLLNRLYVKLKEEIAEVAFAGIRRLIEQSTANGPMHDTPLNFIAALMSGVADATITFMINDPSNAETHCIRGF